MNELITVKSLLKRFDLAADRNFGQNFLCDDIQIARLVSALTPGPDATIIEIGPGLGSLTEPLLRLNPKRYIAIEIDRRLENALAERLKFYTEFELVLSDCLKLDLTQVCKGLSEIHVVGNLPYYISTEIMAKVLQELPQASSMLFMLQKEAVQRLLSPAETKMRCPVSVLAEAYGTAEVICELSPSSFYPQPSVYSRSFLLKRHSHSDFVRDPEFASEFYVFLEQVFSQRRKTLMNNLKQSKREYSETKAKAYLEKHSIALNCRAEALSASHLLGLFTEVGSVYR